MAESVVPLPVDDGTENCIFSWSVNAVHAAMMLLARNRVAGVATMLAGWATLYFVLRVLIPSRPAEWICRIVTVVHAVIVVVMSSWSVFIEGPWPFTDPAGPNTLIQNIICIISIAYFIFDFSWCVYFRSEGAVMLFHHIVSLLGNGCVLLRQINGTEVMAAFIGTEITNPLLQLRWMLRYEKLSVRYPFFAELVDLAFVALFTVMRIGVGSALLHDYLNHPRPDWIARTFACTLYAIGWVFWASILRFAFRKYRRMWIGWRENRKQAVSNGTGNGLASACKQ